MPSAPGGADPNPSPIQQAGQQIAALYQQLRSMGASVSTEDVRRAWMTVYHANETGWGMDAGNPGIYDRVLASLSRQLGITQGSDTTGGGSSGGSGSGGGGSTYDAAAARAGFIEVLRGWGLGPTDGDLGKVIDQAVAQKFSGAEFLQAIRATKVYAKKFPGMKWRDGVNEVAYNRDFARYRDMAKDARGFGLTRQEFGGLMHDGIDAQEWSVRVDVANTLNKNPGAREGFAFWLAKHKPGLAPKDKHGKVRPFSLKEMKNILTGMASPAFSQAWDVASTVGSIQGVGGIDVSRRGAGDSVKFGMVERLLKQYNAKGLDQDAEFYARLAQQVGTLIPLSKLRGEKITEEDILKVAFHGKTAGELTHKFTQLIANAKAEDEQGSMANPQLAGAEGGGTTLLGYDQNLGSE